jgi:hypothetical protein
MAGLASAFQLRAAHNRRETGVLKVLAYGTKILNVARPWMLAEIAFHQRNIYSAGATPDSGILCPAPARPPQTSEELRAAILDSYEDLSKRLQQIARLCP